MLAVTRQFFVAVIIVATFGTGLLVKGQVGGRGESNSQRAKIVERLEIQTAQFKKTLADGFESSQPRESALENVFMARLAVFAVAAGSLRDRAEHGEINTSDVESVLRQGSYLEVMMNTHSVSPLAAQEWRKAKVLLDNLARLHNISWSWSVEENPRWRHVSVRRVFDRLEKRADDFRDGFDDALDASPLDETRAENAANDLVEAFEEIVDRLGRRVKSGEPTRAEVAKLLVKAIMIDKFMRDHAFPPGVRSDWSRIKANLDELALRNNVIWRWTSPPVIPLAGQNNQVRNPPLFEKS